MAEARVLVQFRWPAEVHAWLVKEAGRRGLSQNALIIEMVQRAMEEEKVAA